MDHDSVIPDDSFVNNVFGHFDPGPVGVRVTTLNNQY